jgi:hypothetical protein
VLARGQDDASQGDLVGRGNRLPDRGECISADLAVGGDVVGADVVVVDLVAWHKLVDVDRPSGLDRNGLEIFIGEFDVLPLRQLV